MAKKIGKTTSKRTISRGKQAPSPNDELGSPELLLRAAKKLFAERGYEGASVKDLALEAGVNVGLISYFFGGKEGLYRACLEQFGHKNLEMAERVLKPPASLEEFRIRLRMFFEEIILTHFTEPELTTIIHRECVSQMPIINEIFKKTFVQVHETLLRFLKEAQRVGVLRQDIDILISSMIFMGSVVHQSRIDRIAESHRNFTLSNPKQREKFLDHITDFAIRSMGVQS